MSSLLSGFKDLFNSLKLTVTLLALSILLVFAATLDQVNIGIWGVQQKYFHSLFVLWTIPGTHIPLPVFPGGYLLGGLLLINLTTAFVFRFKLQAKKIGVILSHLGLILLLLGELFTSLLQQESYVRLSEGETKSHLESQRYNEVAILDITDLAPAPDRVVAIPEKLLAQTAHASTPELQHHALPFRVRVKQYLPNAALSRRDPATPNAQPPVADQGIGPRALLIAQPLSYRDEEPNLPAAVLELLAPDRSLGTWLLSASLDDATFPQTFTYQDRTYRLSFRPAREYLPFSLNLLKVTHDVYPGSDIPKNFASRLQLKSADGHDNREILIYMNNPLRHAGLTFYQHQMTAATGTTGLLVVRNASWQIPYYACAMMGGGLLLHFCISLVAFATKRRVPKPERLKAEGLKAEKDSTITPTPPSSAFRLQPSALLPALALLLALAFVAKTFLPPKNATAFDTVGFSNLPVLANGRIKPLDTIARTTLLQIQNRQSVYLADGAKIDPTTWLLDTLARPERADAYPTFKIENPELFTLIGQTEDSLRINHTSTAKRVLAVLGFLPGTRSRFSLDEMRPHVAAIEAQARLAYDVETAQRSRFQKAIVKLHQSLIAYHQLKHAFTLPGADKFDEELTRFAQNLPVGMASFQARQRNEPYDENALRVLARTLDGLTFLADTGKLLTVPPPEGSDDINDWATSGTTLIRTVQTGQLNPAALRLAQLAQAWREQNSEKFNQIVHAHQAEMNARFPHKLQKSQVEARFNHAEPFYNSMQLYAVVLALALASWMLWPAALGRAAFWINLVAWLLTTGGLFARMWLEGRPPVTNLYSSAVFVAWVAVFLCLILEAVFKNALASAAGGIIGFCALIIAHHLSYSGDTMEMMRAVLDSNFWLGTHVITVTVGYGATFLAGILGFLYILLGMFSKGLNKPTADTLARMTYGIVCFATLFSLVGTVLGGIWADQSWGRFWGWDPKENGAIMIVLWNALILHARWGGLVKARGLMCLALVGNIITAWSWFGTNMLGVGLHSYGFMDAAFNALLAFVIFNLCMILIAQLPLRYWRSFRETKTA